MKRQVAVVIPIYKSELFWYEKIALRQVTIVLHAYDIIFVAPENMRFNYDYEGVSVKRFPKDYFDGIKNYNLLMMSKFFYDEFTDYDYILIYQLDAFVFSDQLSRF